MRASIARYAIPATPAHAKNSGEPRAARVIAIRIIDARNRAPVIASDNESDCIRGWFGL